MALKIFRAERYVFTLKFEDKSWKIFQIFFGKSDGSLFVNFPYFKSSEGLVSIVSFPKHSPYKQSLSLEEGGKVTSNLVKYSHHPDGRAHFSQTGLVKTSIRKNAVPLSKVEGHIFTIQFKGLQGFDLITKKNNAPSTIKKTTLQFNVDDLKSESFKIVGNWYFYKNLIERIEGDDVLGPIVSIQKPDGNSKNALLIGQPENFPLGGYILVISCTRIPKFTTTDENILTFIGGFDPPSVLNDLNKKTTFLALSYPASNYKELCNRLECIDLNKN